MLVRRILYLCAMPLLLLSASRAIGDEEAAPNLHVRRAEQQLPYATVRVRCVDERGKHLHRDQRLVYYPAGRKRWLAMWHGDAIQIPLASGFPRGRLYVVVPGYERATFDLSAKPQAVLTKTLLESRLRFVRFSVRNGRNEDIRVHLRYGLQGPVDRTYLRPPGWTPGQEAPDVPLPAHAPMIRDGLLAVFARSGQNIVHPGRSELVIPGEEIEFTIETVPEVRFVLPEGAKMRRAGIRHRMPGLVRGALPSNWDAQRLRDYGHWTLECGPHRHVSDHPGVGSYSARLPVGIQYHFIVGMNRISAGVHESELWYGERSSDEKTVHLIGGALVEAELSIKVPEGASTVDAALFPGRLPAEVVQGRALRVPLHGRRVTLRNGRAKVRFPRALQRATAYSKELGVAWLTRSRAGVLEGAFFRGAVELVPSAGMTGPISVSLKSDDGDSGVVWGSTYRPVRGVLGKEEPLVLRGYPPGRYRAHFVWGGVEWWQTIETPTSGTVRVELIPPQ